MATTQFFRRSDAASRLRSGSVRNASDTSNTNASTAWPSPPVPSSPCEGVGVVERVHTLLCGVHRLSTALKVVEEVQEEVQVIKDELGGEEVGWNGELKVEE